MNQVLVDHGVEVRVVDDVVDVPVGVIVHPARGYRQEAPEIGASQSRLHLVSGRGVTRERNLASNNSTQWRTGRALTLCRCVRQPMFAVAMISGSPASSAAILSALSLSESAACRIE